MAFVLLLELAYLVVDFLNSQAGGCLDFVRRSVT